jgi:hypothetical protein
MLTKSHTAKQMETFLGLRSTNFNWDRRFIPLATLVKVLVEISLTFTAVMVAMSLTSMQLLLAI